MIEGDKPTLNPYFYIPKYRSSDALPAPEIFPLQERRRKKKFTMVYIILWVTVSAVSYLDHFLIIYDGSERVNLDSIYR